MEAVVDEAINTFRTVLDPRDGIKNIDLEAEAGTTEEDRSNDTVVLVAPPNSPNNNSSNITVGTNTAFDFDFVTSNSNNGPSNAIACSNNINSSSEEEQQQQQQVRLRRQRKRRRVPSFKTKQAPRVAPKASCNSNINTNSDEADDEASDVDQVDFVAMSNLDISDKKKSSNNKDISDVSELHLLKLKVLSEAQKTVAKAKEITDWAKVGAELRLIADKFSDDKSTNNDEDEGNSSSSDTSSHNNSDNRTVVSQIDFVSMVNLMLPFSVPQSLWSALVSYAAWKIFKRFQ